MYAIHTLAIASYPLHQELANVVLAAAAGGVVAQGKVPSGSKYNPLVAVVVHRRGSYLFCGNTPLKNSFCELGLINYISTSFSIAK